MNALIAAWKGVQWLSMVVGVLALGPLCALVFGPVSFHGDWRTASSRSTGQAPDPADERGPVVQVYAARAFGWRGAFSVHTWLAVKPANADHYTRYEVVGWGLYRGHSALSASSRLGPDAEWYGARPILIADRRNDQAAAIIAALPQVLAAYPYAKTYTMWPGPNSNTFLAYLGRAIPQLRLSLPANAIGKDYLPAPRFLAKAPSGTGFQLSLSGVVGVLAARDEGLELNLLGLVVGVDLRHPAVKLPGFGCIPDCTGAQRQASTGTVRS